MLLAKELKAGFRDLDKHTLAPDTGFPQWLAHASVVQCAQILAAYFLLLPLREDAGISLGKWTDNGSPTRCKTVLQPACRAPLLKKDEHDLPATPCV